MDRKYAPWVSGRQRGHLSCIFSGVLHYRNLNVSGIYMVAVIWGVQKLLNFFWVSLNFGDNW